MANDAFTTGALLLGGGFAGYLLGHWLEPHAPSPATSPRNARPRPRSHRDVYFAVHDAAGEQQVFKTLNDAAGFAVGIALAKGARVHLDVLVMSRAGAKWWGGDDAVQAYDEDPEASVFERLVVQASAQGRVP